MNRDEIIEILSKTQQNNALLNRGAFPDVLSDAIINAIDEATDEESGEVNLEDVKDRLRYMELETRKAQRKALEIFEDSLPEEKEYNIQVCRTGIGFATITVHATTQEEAEEQALEEAGDHNYNENNADYTIV